MNLSLKEIPCVTLSLETLQPILLRNLKQYFSHVEVEVTACPDLTEKPFQFPLSNISEGAILDVGGPQNLTPRPNLEKKYSLTQLLELCNILQIPNGVIFGPCAGPFWEVEQLCEMVACKISNLEKSNSFIGLVDTNTQKAVCKSTMSNFGIMGNFFVTSVEKMSPVLKIKVSKRLRDENFTGSIRKAIAESFPEQVISLGGLFTVSNATVNCHVVQEFSSSSLETDGNVNNWLQLVKFFAFKSPMTFACVMHCFDPGYKLCMEHSHGLNEGLGQLGHYHSDLEPELVEYEGVFSLASKIIRIDMPEK